MQVSRRLSGAIMPSKPSDARQRISDAPRTGLTSLSQDITLLDCFPFTMNSLLPAIPYLVSMMMRSRSGWSPSNIDNIVENRRTAHLSGLVGPPSDGLRVLSRNNLENAKGLKEMHAFLALEKEWLRIEKALVEDKAKSVE